ncbi:MAG: UDP-N-acetylglucosamine 2-epimerase (non-hydrolyzing) [ANME-2 cluster archaeon]|nr:UDP-N-acetylglucosamine 2-epimerase (non-hydrolyzing) [ANME-2 cluster archaeon]
MILGTRPEIIKMSPVIRECEQKNLDHFILHTGQHYSYNMDRVFFEQLELPEARYNLDVGSCTHAEQTGKILAGVEPVLMKEQPDAVLVQGDTNTVLAGALAASKLHIRVGHVEAGLRSNDRRMPEEINRVLADHCSDYLFAPTKKAKDILLGEGIPEDLIYVTGNTIVDAVRQNVKIAAERTSILNELDIEPGHYILTTAHRQENVDDRVRLTGILQGLESVAEEFDMPVIFPIHPRTGKRIREFGISTNGSIRLIEPVDFLSFLQLEREAGLILTDSGGVQEESCILGVPCVTLRDNTERPETLEVGANVLAGTEPGRIVECARIMMEREAVWSNPFGDGTAAEKIRRVLVMAEDKSSIE